MAIILLRFFFLLCYIIVYFWQDLTVSTNKFSSSLRTRSSEEITGLSSCAISLESEEGY